MGSKDKGFQKILMENSFAEVGVKIKKRFPRSREELKLWITFLDERFEIFLATHIRNHDRVSHGYIDVVYVTGESSTHIKIIARVYDVTFADDECRLFLETFAGIYNVIVTGGKLNNGSCLPRGYKPLPHHIRR